MTRTRQPLPIESPAPDQREVPDPETRGYDLMQVFQSLTEIQKDLSAISTKTDRLITDVDKIDRKVNDLSHTLAWAKGFGIAAVLLIPLCATFIWWLAGDKINRLRDELIGARPAIIQPSSPTQTK